eukprot:PhF_6_TR8642/c0_g1_i1/m.13500/K17989/SDS, SDH, CHA1; L-serine/L-threonine ammonia-lyase
MHASTPLLRSTALETLLGIPVYLKMENMQPSGSFKLRGIGRLCHHYVKERGCVELVCSSGGNAGLACAWAGRDLGVRVTVVLPTSSPQQTKAKLEALGATVVVHGSQWSEADALAQTMVAEDKSQRKGYVHPFDHSLIWEGHASMITEAAEVMKSPPGAIVLSVGGGGLMLGVSRGMDIVGGDWSSVPIIASETKGCDSLAQSVEQSKMITLPAITSVAKTLGASRVAVEAFELTRKKKVIPCVVSDHEAISAVNSFLDDHRVLVEPACGAALAVLYQKKQELMKLNVQSVLVIVCGGSLISSTELRNLNS